MEQLIQKLHDLEATQFQLNMIDRWTPTDYEYSDMLHNRIKEIKAELKSKYNWEEWKYVITIDF